MPVKELRISSMSQYTELCFKDMMQEFGRYRSNYVFRGMTDSNYALYPSLYRNCSKKPKLEGAMLRNFEKYMELPQPNRYTDFWDIMVLGQHHGLPTRLLDWTFSPLIALHFATDDSLKMNTDGVVWMVNVHYVNKNTPEIFTKLLRGDQLFFTIKNLKDVTQNREDELGYFDKIIEDSFLFFEPPSIDARIVNQYALFSIASLKHQLLDDLIGSMEVESFKIIIPKEIKWEIRDKLDQLNITERVIYPGLDGLAKWLARNYYTV